jgi:hypothetical protein
MKDISEYALARVTGGVPVCPLVIEPNLALWTIADGLCNELEVVCPKPATPQSLTASPGRFIPCLKYILGEYDKIYFQHANSKESSAQVLPRLFAITPAPSFRWRFISINAELLASFFPTISNPDCPAEYTSVFYSIFNFEQFRYER